MTSRLGRKSTGTPDSARISSSNRPTSPTRQSRLQEKADLQNLNDRLASYIDKMRHLESENSRLTREVQTSQTTVTREVTKLKSMYETELGDTRKILDETARERAKLEIDLKRIYEENTDLHQKLDKKTKDLVLAQNTVRTLENRVEHLQSQYNAALNDRKKCSDELKDAEKELLKLRKQVDELRKALEEETLARIDLQNNISSLREELQFKDQIHHQEITETRSKRQTEINEIDGRLAQQYETKLREALQDLRDQYESQICQNRDEIELLYENKIKNLQDAASRTNNATSTAIEEVRKTRSRMEGLTTRIGELETINSSLQKRLRELEKMLEDERLRHAEELARSEDEKNRLRNEMSAQLQEYQDLMDIKISLDLEISAYRKLLEGEEERLNISTSSQNESSSSTSSAGHRIITRSKDSPGGVTKRKRTIIEESMTTTKNMKSH